MTKHSKRPTPEIARKYLVNLNKGYHEISSQAKNEISKDFGIESGAFDLIKLPRQIGNSSLSKNDIRKMNNKVRKKMILIEMKSSDMNINRSLKNLFFSYTYKEQMAAQKLGDRFRIVFVILPRDGSPRFHKTMTYRGLWAKARIMHISWQIRF